MDIVFLSNILCIYCE